MNKNRSMSRSIYWALVLLSAVVSYSQVFSLEEQCAMDKTSKRLMALIDTDFQGTVFFNSGQQYIFPHMNFTCDGLITKLTIGAASSGQDEVLDLEIQIWRNVVNDTYSVVASNTIVFDDEKTSSQIYDFVPNPPLEFREGDILGYFQPQSRMIILGEHNSKLYQLYQPVMSTLPPTTVTLADLVESESRILPLIAIEIGKESNQQSPSECSNGFITEERLRLVASVTALQQQTQSLFPLLSFKYNGAITQVKIALDSCSNHTKFSDLENPPELQIWQESVYMPNTYAKLDQVNISADALILNTHFLVSSFSVEPPLEFMEGDVVGLFVPITMLTPYYYHEPNISGVSYLAESSESMENFVPDSVGITFENILPLISFEIDINNGTKTTESDTYSIGAIAGIMVVLIVTLTAALCILFAKTRQIRNRKRDQNRPTNQEIDSTAIETDENVAYNTTNLHNIVIEEDIERNSGQYTYVTPTIGTTDVTATLPENYIHPYHIPYEPTRKLSSLPLVDEEESDSAEEMEPTYDNLVTSTAAPAVESPVYADPARVVNTYQNTCGMLETHNYENTMNAVQDIEEHTYRNIIV